MYSSVCTGETSVRIFRGKEEGLPFSRYIWRKPSFVKLSAVCTGSYELDPRYERVTNAQSLLLWWRHNALTQLFALLEY